MIVAIVAAAVGAAGSISLPVPVFAPELRATNCAVETERKVLLGHGEAAATTLQPLMEANRQLTARMMGHADRLVAKGVWKEADRSRFASQLFASPDFIAHISEVSTMLEAMMEPISALTAVPSDEVRSCRAVLTILEQVDRSVPLTEKGWNLVDRAYANEAKRLGVSLD